MVRGPTCGRCSGFTILETVLALYIVTVAVILTSHAARIPLKGQSIARDQSLGLLLAERRLEEITFTCRDSKKFQEVLIALDKAGGNVTDGDLFTVGGGFSSSLPSFEARRHDRFATQVWLWRYVLRVPFRYGPPSSDRRSWKMEKSMILARVTVGWGNPDLKKDAEEQPQRVTLLGMVPEPPRRISSLVISKIPQMDLNKLVPVQATASDSLGTIPDIYFRWYIRPKTGNATVLYNPPGVAASIYHGVLFPDGIWRPVPGQAELNLRASSDGREVWAREVLTLPTSSPAPTSVLDPHTLK